MYFIPLYNLGNNNLKNLQKIQTSLEISVPFNSQFYISALKLTFPDSITIVDLRNFSRKCFVLSLSYTSGRFSIHCVYKDFCLSVSSRMSMKFSNSTEPFLSRSKKQKMA